MEKQTKAEHAVAAKPHHLHAIFRHFITRSLLGIHSSPLFPSEVTYGELAMGVASLSIEKSRARNTVMKIKVEVKTKKLAPEGVHAAKVQTIEDSGGGKCVIKFGFTAGEDEFTVEKGYTAKLDRKSPLTRDAQTVMQRPFNDEELEGQFDLDMLIGKPCRVVILHKRSNGGVMKATVETVLLAEKEELPGVTGEVVEKKEGSEA